MAGFIVGITGGIGSGKTTVTDQLANKGIDIIDADIVARQVVDIGTKGLQEIVKHFGNDVLLSDGSLNRKSLREIVFANESNKQWLNNLLHPMIRAEIIEQLAQAKSPYVVLSAPLMFENNLQILTSRTLLIDIDVETQIKRSTVRDDVSKESIRRIIASQMERENRIKLADDIIDNSTLSFADLTNKVEKFHQTYLNAAKKHA